MGSESSFASFYEKSGPSAAGASPSTGASASTGAGADAAGLPGLCYFSAASIASYVDSPPSALASSTASALIAYYMAAKALSSSASFYTILIASQLYNNAIAINATPFIFLL